MAGEKIRQIINEYSSGMNYTAKAELHKKLGDLHKDDLIEFIVENRDVISELDE